MSKSNKINVSSEVGTLRRLLIHSPDAGIGKVIPSKAQDWLFEDIIHLDTMRSKEYDLFTKVLLYFLDPEKVKGKIGDIDHPNQNRDFYKPDKSTYFQSDKVIDPQFLLAEILENKEVKNKLVASVCSFERTSYSTQENLFKLENQDLARTLISGILLTQKMIFPPVPNFIFTRDIAVVVNDHIMLTRPATEARSREAILTAFIMFNHEMFSEYKDKIIEITNKQDYFLYDDNEKKYKNVTVEGGDVMTVAPNHLLIGCSERTSLHAASVVIQQLFSRNVVDKVSVVQIPNKRAFMHIDTTFTQVKRNLWVIHAPFSKQGTDYDTKDLIPELGEPTEKFTLNISQFQKGKVDQPIKFDYLEDLLDDISQKDLNSIEKTEFIYSGDGVFPFGQREQWTDSCNVLALKEGVVIAYDRNDKTAEGFKRKGFNVIHANDLLNQFENNESSPEEISNTLILLPSGELSRARGGSHCLSMPLFRDPIV
ncbi:MAG: amidinotransferase [Flammeovirgaceae bacterium]|nr:amidinotransferase [Flammeovirgaceae bacterium]